MTVLNCDRRAPDCLVPDDTSWSVVPGFAYRSSDNEAIMMAAWA
jgi:hypothetical protein